MRLPKPKSALIAEEFSDYSHHHKRLAIEHRVSGEEREAELHEAAAKAAEAVVERPLDTLATSVALRAGATADHVTHLARKARR